MLKLHIRPLSASAEAKNIAFGRSLDVVATDCVHDAVKSSFKNCKMTSKLWPLTSSLLTMKSNSMSMYLPKRLELSFLSVFALPKA